MSARAALAEVETAPSTEGVLRFREDGTFTIVQFTDLHWGNGNERDKQSLALMEAVLHEERPDLVVFTGDQIGGKKCLSAHKAIEWFTKPCVERALPWAAVFGNHDDECGVSREEQMDIMRSIPHCLAEPGPEDLPGVGHYVLPVHAGQGDKPAALLYCIDSLAYSEVEEIKGYDWIRPRQVQWYREKAAEYRALSSGEPLPALAFFHIPLPEYDIIWEKGDCIGQKHENVCCPKINSGLFAAMHEQGDVMGVFVGHDHVNDYIGELGGIRLAYGRGTGFDTYGRKDMPRGARVILLKEGKRDFKTWLRLEGGEKVEQDIGAP
ncbi:MAG TPA: metallophosphoesterase [Candidatus Hydrogenedentes bacterium]|nr:metallophosphoesterase [Candidatus Hydrogenedentota bacterium]